MRGKRTARIAFIGIVIATATILSGCGPGGPGKGKGGIVVIGPHITEVLFALDQGHRITAVDSFSDYPFEVSSLETVGGYIDPNLEKISLLNPALIITGGRPAKLTQYAELNGIQIFDVHMDSVAAIDTGIRELGTLLGCQNSAGGLCWKIGEDIAAVREAVKDKPRPKVLIVTGRQAHDLNSIPTAGGSSFVSELVTIAGGQNIYEDAGLAYLEASKETITVQQPDVILEFHCGRGLTESQETGLYNDWRAFPGLPAFKSGRIYFITESHGLRPGPRVAGIARLIAQLLHSDVLFPA